MNRSDEIRNQLGRTVSSAVMRGISAIMSSEPKSIATPDSVHLGCNVALNSLIPIVPFLANRPHLDREEITEKGPDELVKLLTYERVLFAALIVSRMMGDTTLLNRDVTTEEGEKACELSQEVNFGPFIMGLALEDWKKLTGKDPAEFIDNHLLEAIASNERESLAPFEDFLKGRLASPSSKTLN